jgi:hypothetical protein
MYEKRLLEIQNAISSHHGLAFGSGGVNWKTDLELHSGLHIEPYGRVGIPITEQLLENTQNLGFILSDQGNYLELAAEKFWFKNPKFAKGINSLAKEAAAWLGFTSSKVILEKLLLFKSGSFLKNQTTDQQQKNFVKLIIQFPSVFTGGEILMNNIVDYPDIRSPEIFRLGSEDPERSCEFEYYFAIYHEETLSEFKPLESGVRLFLVCNVFWEENGVFQGLANSLSVNRSLLDLCNEYNQCSYLLPLKGNYINSTIWPEFYWLTGNDLFFVKRLQMISSVLPEHKQFEVYIIVWTAEKYSYQGSRNNDYSNEPSLCYDVKGSLLEYQFQPWEEWLFTEKLNICTEINITTSDNWHNVKTNVKQAFLLAIIPKQKSPILQYFLNSGFYESVQQITHQLYQEPSLDLKIKLFQDFFQTLRSLKFFQYQEEEIILIEELIEQFDDPRAHFVFLKSRPNCGNETALYQRVLRNHLAKSLVGWEDGDIRKYIFKGFAHDDTNAAHFLFSIIPDNINVHSRLEEVDYSRQDTKENPLTQVETIVKIGNNILDNLCTFLHDYDSVVYLFRLWEMIPVSNAMKERLVCPLAIRNFSGTVYELHALYSLAKDSIYFKELVPVILYFYKQCTAVVRDAALVGKFIWFAVQLDDPEPLLLEVIDILNYQSFHIGVDALQEVLLQFEELPNTPYHDKYFGMATKSFSRYDGRATNKR